MRHQSRSHGIFRRDSIVHCAWFLLKWVYARHCGYSILAVVRPLGSILIGLVRHKKVFLEIRFGNEVSMKNVFLFAAYGRRREKNNIAVRKSREKKRQEIKKFADEHMKLRREVEQMRVQNEKLKVLVSEVEEGILDKSKTELAAMIHKVKKQMDW